MSATPSCSVTSLTVAFPTGQSRQLRAVHDVSFDVSPGSSLGIVGESGSGKSTMALAILGLIAFPGMVSGRVDVDGQDLMSLSRRGLAQIRGRKIGLILQDATSSMNPVRTIGSQLKEAAHHAGLKGDLARRQIDQGLREVELDPDKVLPRYPWELSGGMNQRVAIAMALLQSPGLLIADEPTSALDVTVQASILQLLARLRREREMSLIIISHDLGVIYQITDRIAVMHAGELVEYGRTEAVIGHPSHPYTQGLVGSILELDTPVGNMKGIAGHVGRMFVGDDLCTFANRCPIAHQICREHRPPEYVTDSGARVRCWAREPGTEWEA